MRFMSPCRDRSACRKPRLENGRACCNRLLHLLPCRHHACHACKHANPARYDTSWWSGTGLKSLISTNLPGRWSSMAPPYRSLGSRFSCTGGCTILSSKRLELLAGTVRKLIAALQVMTGKCTAFEEQHCQGFNMHNVALFKRVLKCKTSVGIATGMAWNVSFQCTNNMLCEVH